MSLLWLLQSFRNLAIGKYEFSTFSFSWLNFLCPCFFMVNFRISLWIFVFNGRKQTAEILIEIMLYLLMNFGSTAILTILKFPICKHGVSLHLFISFFISFNNVFFHFQFCISFATFFIFWCYYKWDVVLNFNFKWSIVSA